MESNITLGTKDINPDTTVIEYKRLNLFIEVLRYRPVMNNTTIVYKADFEEGSCLYFLVVNGYSRYGFENWKHQLFMEMIAFYNTNVVQMDAVCIQSANRLATLFYDATKDEKAGVFSNDWDDYFECVPETANPAQLPIF